MSSSTSTPCSRRAPGRTRAPRVGVGLADEGEVLLVREEYRTVDIEALDHLYVHGNGAAHVGGVVEEFAVALVRVEVADVHPPPSTSTGQISVAPARTSGTSMWPSVRFSRSASVSTP